MLGRQRAAHRVHNAPGRNGGAGGGNGGNGGEGAKYVITTSPFPPLHSSAQGARFEPFFWPFLLEVLYGPLRLGLPLWPEPVPPPSPSSSSRIGRRRHETSI